jgi:hypothetical protein
VLHLSGERQFFIVKYLHDCMVFQGCQEGLDFGK